MKKIWLLFVFTGIISNFFAQTQVFDFENLTVPDTGFWNGADTSVYKDNFGDNFVSFLNSYNKDYDSWAGFSFSNWTNTADPTYDNQWSVYTGNAYSGNNFGLGYESEYTNEFPTIIFSQPVNIESIYITNSTYTALVIRDGNSFSQPFSTADQDFYKIDIYGISGNDTTGYVEFYLADYRTKDSIIIDTWQNIDLSALGEITSLKFDLTTSDVGSWGSNTPLYFCIDNVSYSVSSLNINETEKSNISIFPNPAKNFINISEDVIKVEVFDFSGRLLKTTNTNFVNISDLPVNTYLLKIYTKTDIKYAKFVKF